MPFLVPFFLYPPPPPKAHFYVNSLSRNEMKTSFSPADRAVTAAGWAGPQPCCQLSTHHCLFSVAAELWVGARVAEKGDVSPVLPQGPAPQAEDDRQQLKGFCF